MVNGVYVWLAGIVICGIIGRWMAPVASIGIITWTIIVYLACKNNLGDIKDER